MKLAATLLLAAASASISAEPPSRVLTPNQVEQCRALHGRVERVCMVQAEMCVVPFSDAGKRCTDKSDCQGRCLYQGPPPKTGKRVTGTCEPSNQPCGCQSWVEKGRLAGGICAD